MHRIGQHLSTVLTFAVLGGLFWWGHSQGWRITKPTLDSPRSDTEAEAWCPEHHVSEADCLLCRKSLGKAFIAKEPAHQRYSGESIRFAQIASPDVLTKVGIQVEPVSFASTYPRIQAPSETRYPPEAVARLGSRSDGVVRHVLVHIGSIVPADAVVAVLETAEVGVFKSQLMQAVTALDLAQAQAQRARLSAAAGIRTPADLEEVESRLRSCEVAVFNAEQGLRNLGLAIAASSLSGLDAATLTERLRRLGLPPDYADGGSANLLPVRAPRAGTVTDIHTVVGESVLAHEPLIVVADTSILWATIPVLPEQANQVAIGQVVTLAGAGTGTGAEGTVVAIAQAADPTTRLVTIWAALNNVEQHLRVGLVGTATITTGPAVKAALIPAQSVQFDGDQACVFVQRTATVFRCLAVKVLAREADGQFAVDRLAEGDVIAVRGTDTLFAIAFQERMGAGCCAGE